MHGQCMHAVIRFHSIAVVVDQLIAARKHSMCFDQSNARMLYHDVAGLCSSWHDQEVMITLSFGIYSG